MKLPENVSESIKRLNPALFGGVRQLPAAKPRQPELEALDGQAPRKKTRRGSLGKSRPILRILLCRFSSRPMRDASESLPFACKQIRDAIAASLEIDDADKNVDWQYASVTKRGRKGCFVMIEVL